MSSYRTDVTPFLHVYLASGGDDSGNYGTGTADGFPFDTVKSSATGVTWNNTTKTATINVKGLYLINYGYSIRNNTDDTGSDLIDMGITHTRGTTYKYYIQTIAAEWFQNNVRYPVTNSIFINCEANDTIKGYISDRGTTQYNESGYGATYLSIGMFAAFY